MSLHKRLERLEERAGEKKGYKSPYYLLYYFKEIENIERQGKGLPPLPYTEEHREEHRRCLAETIPAYRQDKGWQHEGGQAFLDDWEEEVRTRIRKEEWT